MRLLFDQEWYESVSSAGQFEADYEALIRSRASWLFPDFQTVPFKIPVESEDGRKIPDLALVDRYYRSWWVVEVEMAHHSLQGHVIPQVEVFARGKYGQEHAEYMVDKCASLNFTSLSDMMKGAQPRVLVVVNQSVPNWLDPIHRLFGLIATVEIFRSSRNQHIFRMNGDYPNSSSPNILSACRLDSSIPRLLRIDSPAALGIGNNEKIQIRFLGGLTSWSRLDTSDGVWLCPLGRNPLTKDRDYLIVSDPDGHTSFNLAC